MPDDVLLIEPGQVTVLTINRPDAMNALNDDVISAVTAFFEKPPKDTRCVIITGAGKAFVAGADIKQLAGLTAETAPEVIQRGQEMMNLISESTFPVIAAVNGFALGGGQEVALACDIIIASIKAKLGAPEVTLKILPGYGGTQRLPRRIGAAQAKLLMWTGELVKASDALALGLVDQVVEPDDLMSTAHELAENLAAQHPASIAAIKHSVDKGLDVPVAKGFKIEGTYFRGLVLQDAAKTALADFGKK